MWQDTVIALCQLSFVPALLPTIRGTEKPALTTCVMNAVIVSAIAVTQATLGLWYSVSTSSLTVVAWIILTIQKLRMRPSADPTSLHPS
jgi:hypothetical protein